MGFTTEGTERIRIQDSGCREEGYPTECLGPVPRIHHPESYKSFSLLHAPCFILCVLGASVVILKIGMLLLRRFYARD